VLELLVVCPQERDLRAAHTRALADHYAVRLAGTDPDYDPDFDPEGLLDECERIPADGVVGTKDRSALVAALVGARRGLSGPSPEALVRCQHKPTSRALQREAVPEATPRFALLDGEPLSFPPPWFVKPVVGRLSQEARRVDEPAGLSRIRDEPDYRDGYARIAALAGLPPDAVRGFLVEELVTGDEVTLEGYVHGRRVTVIGVTDSVKYPSTSSFWRFEYPSALPGERQAELAGVSKRLLPALGFDGGFFNVEFLVPAAGPAQVVEVNGRIASQFAPLVEAVHGRSTYDALFALHCGQDPAWDEGPGRGVAISYVMRVFEDALVESVPAAEEDVELLVRPGLRLSEQGTNDAASYRLAIFNCWGETREQAVARCRERAERLRFELRP
jgi:hypothetical protein